MAKGKKGGKRNAKGITEIVDKDNRVAGARIPIQILVDYRADGSYLFDFCKDVGTGGIFIETESPQNVGEELELTFTIPDSKETLTTTGKVIWIQQEISTKNKSRTQSAGMGIQFVEFSTESKSILEEFVRRYTVEESA